MSQLRRAVAIIVQDPLSIVASGPFAGFWQVLYLLRQGFSVLLVSNTDTLEVPLPLQVYMAHGTLQFSSSLADSGCGWLHRFHDTPFHYVHFDVLGNSDNAKMVEAALLCISSRTAAKELSQALPTFVSLQLPGSVAELATAVATRSMAWLVAQGYLRFKVTRVVQRNSSRGPLGAPIGELAPDAVTGLQWRKVSQLITQSLTGFQLHAFL